MRVCFGNLVFLVAMVALSSGAQSRSRAEQSEVSSNIQTEIYNQEHQLANAEKTKDRHYFEKTLDDKLIFVVYNGLVFTKQKIVQDLTYIDVTRYSIANMKVRALGPEAALATYDLDLNGSIAGHALPTKQYASSVWLKNGEWRLKFHQSTPAHH
jgi:hypothetical protein